MSPRSLVDRASTEFVRLPVRLDIRDHVVLAGALGILAGAVDPIQDGAPDVARFSSALASRFPGHQPAFTEAQILAAPKPMGLHRRELLHRWLAEARLNWCNWREALTHCTDPALAELLTATARLLDGAGPASTR